MFIQARTAFGNCPSRHAVTIMSRIVGGGVSAALLPMVKPLARSNPRRLPINIFNSPRESSITQYKTVHNACLYGQVSEVFARQKRGPSVSTFTISSSNKTYSTPHLPRVVNRSMLLNSRNSDYNVLDYREDSRFFSVAFRRSLNSDHRRGLHLPRKKDQAPITKDPNYSAPEPGDLSQLPKRKSVPLAASAKAAASGPANKHLIDHLPNLAHLHRPSKEELLAAATGFWSRLKVRFKWFSIRSARPFNIDEIGAFFSWFLLGHVLWIILGTTTFFSLAIFAVNTVFAQETLARWVGNYLTKSSGVKVVFESAIVPKWGDGVITFKNVFVSRRPGQGAGKVSKGSPGTAAAAAAATVVADRARESEKLEEEDSNYTQFDLSLETVNVTLSFTKWFNSKGLLRDVEVKGVRGVVDRTSIHYTGEYVDPRTYKKEHNPGDFEIDSFKMEDLLVTVYQPNMFRPFSVSVFSCDLPQLRRQWLFYDFLSANNMSGSFDESLFTIHPRQMHGQTGAQLASSIDAGGGQSPWKKQSRLRIDDLSIDHLNRDVPGPFSWIHEGNVDIAADVMFPADNDESIAKVMSDFYDRLEATVHSTPQVGKSDDSQSTESTTVSGKPSLEFTRANEELKGDGRSLVMDVRVHLNDVRAAVPLFTKDLSYVNNALIRPIVAYINARKAFIPINCTVVKRVSEFDGSWTMFDSGLMDDLSAEVCDPHRDQTLIAAN